LLASICFVDKV